MKATFHERQYELAVNLELVAGSGMFFAPMQVVEESVGYDIALVPGAQLVAGDVEARPDRIAAPIGGHRQRFRIVLGAIELKIPDGQRLARLDHPAAHFKGRFE